MLKLLITVSLDARSESVLSHLLSFEQIGLLPFNNRPHLLHGFISENANLLPPAVCRARALPSCQLVALVYWPRHIGAASPLFIHDP